MHIRCRHIQDAEAIHAKHTQGEIRHPVSRWTRNGGDAAACAMIHVETISVLLIAEWSLHVHVMYLAVFIWSAIGIAGMFLGGDNHWVFKCHVVNFAGILRFYGFAVIYRQQSLSG